MTDFEKKVYEATKKVPEGSVSTYKEIAKQIGKPNAARAVGNALNKNPYAPAVPCHRIIKSNREIGDYAGGAQKKKALLKKEGLVIKNGKVV